MKNPLVAVVVLSVLTGCASDKYSQMSVTRQDPGYGVMLATFRYVPGVSAFPESKVLKDAKFTCDALAGLKYHPFIVYNGHDVARVGIRASSFALAKVYKKDLESKGSLYLGSGADLPLSNVEILNIAELKLGAADNIP